MRFKYIAFLPLIISCTAYAAQNYEPSRVKPNSSTVSKPVTKGATAKPVTKGATAKPVTKGATAKPVTKGAVYQAPVEIKHERVQHLNTVAALRVGWDYAAIGKDQHISFLRTDPAPDLFQTNETNSSRAVFGALLGIEFPMRYAYPMRWQTGVGFYQTNSFKTDGVDYFFSLPEFGNISYSYHVKNQRVMLENKFLFEMHRYILGYVLAGVGASFNKAYDYEEKSIDPTTPATGVFQDNTTASLSYSGGFGIEGIVNKYFRIGLGYQYSDLGEITLGQYNNGNTGQTLSTIPTSTQEIILQFTAIF